MVKNDPDRIKKCRHFDRHSCVNLKRKMSLKTSILNSSRLKNKRANRGAVVICSA